MRFKSRTLEQGVTDFDLGKQKSFGQGQIYPALSRVKTYDNLYCIGEFKKCAIKVNEDALLEYERPKQNDLFSTITRNTISDDTIRVLVHNVRSLSKNVDDIVCDKRLINNDIIGFTETQINPSNSTCKIIKTLNFFNINFNNNENKFLSLAYGYRNVVVLDKFDTNGVSIFSFKKHAFANRVFTLMLVYRKQFLGMQEFSELMQYLLAAHSIDIIAGDLNYDLLKVIENKLLYIFTDHVQMVNKTTHISGSLIDHVYIKKTLMEEFCTNATVENIYFSDHDALRIVIKKNAVDFHINL